jgi:formylmethanofuran dehydrogenase subunit B
MAQLRIVADVTCLGCGCLCDDINVHVDGDRIIAAEHACELGLGWFHRERPGPGDPPATIDGRAAPLDEALDRAAAVLSAARAPLVLGLRGATLEAQAAAVALAEQIGAAIDPAHAAAALPRRLAVARVGQVSATLGEVKNRADVVVYWGCDPLATHPRHWSRYAVEPAGRFLPEGRAGRFVIVVDEHATETSRQSNFFIQVNRDRFASLLAAVRGLVRGARIVPGHVERATGGSSETLRALADHLAGARYGALFFDDSLAAAPGGSATVEAALLLVRDLNLRGAGRFVALSLGAPANAAGAEAVLGWQTGAPLAVDLARGIPRYLPGESGAEARLGSEQTDAALIIADDPESDLSAKSRAHLERIPIVVIAPDACAAGRSLRPAVGLASAAAGVESGGTVLRTDGVTLPLRPPLAATRPSDRALIRALTDRLDGARGSLQPPGVAPGDRERSCDSVST